MAGLESPPHRLARRLTRRLASILPLSLVAVAASCGAGVNQSLAMDITEARWRGDAVVVNGAWMKGVSTPPACKLLESRNGEIVGRFGLEGAAFDAGAFSLEFIPDSPPSGTGGDYHVQCSVMLDSAKTVTDTAPVTVRG